MHAKVNPPFTSTSFVYDVPMASETPVDDQKCSIAGWGKLQEVIATARAGPSVFFSVNFLSFAITERSFAKSTATSQRKHNQSCKM